MSAPPRALRPRRPARALDPAGLAEVDALTVELAAHGAIALVDFDMERAHAVGLSIAAGGAWIEVDARTVRDVDALLARLAPQAQRGALDRPEDAVIDALERAGWRLLLTHVGEGWAPAIPALFDAVSRGDAGARLLVLAVVAWVELAPAQQRIRADAPPPEALAPRSHRALSWLNATEVPCSAVALATLTGDPHIEQTLGRLRAAGLAQEAPLGWSPTRTDGSLRAGLPPLIERAAALRAAAVAPTDELAAVSLFIEAGESARALEVLEQGAGRAVTSLPPTLLAAVLTRSSDPRLDRWRLEAAILCGSPDTLAQVPAPLGADAETRAAFAEVLYLRGHLAQARGELAALRSGRALDLSAPARLRAVRVAALIAAQAGEFDVALAELDAVTPAEEAEAAVLDAARALTLALAEREAEALAVVQRRWSDHKRLTGLARERHVSDLLVALVTCERLDLARGYRDEAEPRAAGPMAYLLALIATQSGDLERADALLDHCEQAFDELGAWHARTRALRVRWCLARGALEGLEGRIDAVMRAAERLGDPGLFALGQTYHAALAVLVRCTPPPVRAWPGSAVAERTAEGWPGVFLGRDSARPGSARQRAWGCVMLGHRALLEGRASDALQALDAAITLARQTGFTLDEIGALRLRLDAVWLLDDPDGYRETEAWLVRRGAEQTSLAVAAELRFARALWAKPADAAGLLASADTWDAATRTARRARALLGAPPEGHSVGALDAIDVLVLARARSRLGALRLSGAPDGPWHDAWLLDHAARAVHRPGSPPVSLEPTPLLWTVLTSLIAAGALDKEALLRAAWGVDDYHPLRDDNRLQVTMRKLRGLVEADPAQPRVVKTTSTGYAFEPTLRVLHVNEG